LTIRQLFRRNFEIYFEEEDLVKKLLILGPSYRRKLDEKPLPAFKRYDGIFFRVAKKHLPNVENVDVLVMNDDLILVEPSTPIPYQPPRGREWTELNLPKDLIKKAKEKNKEILNRKLKDKVYSEVFIAMGKRFAEALPDLTQYNIRFVFPRGGPGPKAQALKQWITKSKAIDK